VRFLFTLSGGSGHLDPLVPLARASATAGHTVAFAARPWMVPKAQELGFEAFPSGTDEGLEPVTRPLLELDPERELRDLRDGFGRWIARERAADLMPLYGQWRPDVVVWEETDFGAAIVAERLGLPHANVLVTAAGSFVRADVMAPALDEVRAEHGLPADPGAAMLSRYLVLSPFPPSFRDPAFRPPATTHGLRTWDVDRPETSPSPTPPTWASRLPGAPVVYFTLGTVFNHESGDLFQRVLAGLCELPINLLVTVGREIDPASLGAQPPNVRVERFVPQVEVLPHVDLVVSHAGSGSVLGALAFGRPMVLAPMGADQPLNAQRCAALGVGRVLDAVRATPADVRDAVAAVLEDPSCRAAAQRLRDEIAALPPPEHAVGLLERLAVEREPITAA
jgi:UDP:flavonoid glycosyltransferase YjiC (YdhE family)